MIEATNSVLASAPLVRGNADQASVARSFAASPDQAQGVSAGPRAPFISPFIHVDVNYNKAVLQIRDSDTGDVLRQFPSESTLEARRKAEALKAEPYFSRQESGERTVQTEKTAVPTSTYVAQSVRDGDSVGIAVSEPSFGSGNAQAQVAAAALATSAQAGQISTGNVSVTA